MNQTTTITNAIIYEFVTNSSNFDDNSEVSTGKPFKGHESSSDFENPPQQPKHNHRFQLFHFMNENLQIIIILTFIILMLIAMMCLASHIRRTVWLSSSTKLMERNHHCLHAHYPPPGPQFNGYLNRYGFHHPHQFNHNNRMRLNSNSFMRLQRPSSAPHIPLETLSTVLPPPTSSIFCVPTSPSSVFSHFMPSPAIAYPSLNRSSPSSMANIQRLADNTIIHPDNSPRIIHDVHIENGSHQQQINEPPSYAEIIDDKNSNNQKAEHAEVAPPNYQDLKFE